MSQAEDSMDGKRTMYVCPRIASCSYRDCVYHRIYRDEAAASWFRPNVCPPAGLPLDPFVVVVEEQPA